VLLLWFGAYKMGLNFKIKLYALADDNTQLVEEGECLDWLFQFWDFDDQCCLLQKFEAMNPVCERVYVIP